MLNTTPPPTYTAFGMSLRITLPSPPLREPLIEALCLQREIVLQDGYPEDYTDILCVLPKMPPKVAIFPTVEALAIHGKGDQTSLTNWWQQFVHSNQEFAGVKAEYVP
jgi:hypothetical protein